MGNHVCSTNNILCGCCSNNHVCCSYHVCCSCGDCGSSCDICCSCGDCGSSCDICSTNHVCGSNHICDDVAKYGIYDCLPICASLIWLSNYHTYTHYNHPSCQTSSQER